MSDDAPTDDTEINTEALKLLVQVAAANDHIHDKEREFLEKLARAWKVPEVIEGLFAQIDQAKPLDQPKIAILRARPEKVLRAAEALVAVDGEVDAEEDDVLSQVKMLLAVR